MRASTIFLLVLPAVLLSSAITEPYGYPVHPGTPAWAEFKTGMEMFEACQIPDSILSRLSTRALAVTCISYPLFGNVFAHENPMDGLRWQAENFNGLRELLTREDRAVIAEVVDELADSNYFHGAGFGFLRKEYCGMLLSLPGIMCELDQEVLNGLSAPGTTSSRNAELIPLDEPGAGDAVTMEAGENVGLPVIIPDMSRTDSPNTLYTPKGTQVYPAYKSELTRERLGQYDSTAAALYPEAQILAGSSRRYNCHGHACVISENGPICQLNEGEQHKYPNDGSYVMVPDGSKAEKAYYPYTHSAIVSPDSNLLISKWGSWPLMKHAPDYVPESYGTSVEYYAVCERELDDMAYEAHQEARLAAYYHFTIRNVVISSGARIDFVCKESINVVDGFIVEDGADVTLRNW